MQSSGKSLLTIKSDSLLSFPQKRRIFLISFLWLLILTNFALADEDKSSAPQLKLCWQFSSLETNGIQPTTHQERLFLTMTGGALFALNLTDGATLWRTELGGETVGQTPANDDFVYAASQIAATKEKTAAIIIRALSSETGLTAWQGEFPAAARVALILRQNYLLAATTEATGAQKIFALSADKGELKWTRKMTTELSAAPLIIADSLVFATTDKVLHFLKIADGEEIRTVDLPHLAERGLVFGNGNLLFGDEAGNVSALRETDGKVLWTVRLGGAAQNPIIYGSGVLIPSLDDFVYFHNLGNGQRLWRKRLASRPYGAALISNQAVWLTTTGENSISAFGLKKGKLLNQTAFGGEKTAIAAPLTANNCVFVLTTEGLLAFAPLTMSCPLK